MSDAEILKSRIAYHKAEVGRLRRLKANPQPALAEIERLKVAINNMTSQMLLLQVELTDAPRLIDAHIDDIEKYDAELTELVHGKDIQRLLELTKKLQAAGVEIA